MHPFEKHILRLTRRQFLSRSAQGIGAFALAALLNPSLLSGAYPARPSERWTGVVNPPHFAPRARRVIYLTMAGGPSHLETFDNKPALAAMDGKPMPASVTDGQQIAQLQGRELNCLAPQHPFRKWGDAQQEITTILPHIGSIADEICIIRSMTTEQINHDPAQTLMNTGHRISGLPSMGSWLNYGLGSESENLPGFVVLTSQANIGLQPISTRQWSSGFLPSNFQGVKFNSVGEAVNYVSNPPGVSHTCQSEIVKAIGSIDSELDETVDDPEIAARISQYELAFRMQTSVPELVNFAEEPRHILDLYGTRGADGSFAANCLLARRLAERGVRFIQLYHRGWDHHGRVKRGTEILCSQVDRGTTALILDLKQRGLLDETLIVWGGEFGRTPMAQGTGRDHHIYGFSIFMCGAGIRPGMTYGKTDDLGYHAVENPITVHDFHATLLHLFGIDHKRLTFRHQGRDFRLTDVHGEIVRPILA